MIKSKNLPTMRRNLEVDHVDPKWEPHRDYQLVCGLPDCQFNLCVRDGSENMSKGNRFLPWRWSKDEIGVVPVFKGDLCQFLDPDTNEWVLEEFLGPWWVEKSKATDGRRFQPPTKNRPKGLKYKFKVNEGGRKPHPFFSPVRFEFYRVEIWKKEDPDLSCQVAFKKLLEVCPEVTPKNKKTFQRMWKEKGWELTRLRDEKGRWQKT